MAGIRFLTDIDTKESIQFQNSSGTDAGKIAMDGDDLVLSNAVGDILFGDADSDIYIGDGVNSVDILFEQNGEIRGETGSSVTLTLGSSDTTLSLVSPQISTIVPPSTTLDIKASGAVTGTELKISNSYGESPKSLSFDYSSGGANSTIAQIVGYGRHTTSGGPYLQFKVHDGTDSLDEYMRITKDGYVGIGTTNPTNKLHVAGNIYSSGHINANQYYVSDSIFHNADTDTKIKFDTDRVRIYAGNTVKFDSNNTYLTSINNGNWSGTDLSIANGGTGASTASAARTNLGLGSLATLSAVGASQITDNSVGAAELNVSGNGSSGQVLTSDGDGTFSWTSAGGSGTVTSVGGTGTVNGLTLTGTVTSSGNLTLGGTLAINNSDWSGTDLSIANGGTGASSASAARTNLGLGTAATSASTDFVAVIGDTMTGKLTVEGNGVNWNETTQGQTTGSIHLDPVGTGNDHTGSAITFGASDTGGGATAQAGIYTRTDGGYGTKMYFSTTNDYAAGSKTRMMIHSNGRVGIGTTDPNELFDVAGTARMATAIAEGWVYAGSGIAHWGDGDTSMVFSNDDITFKAGNVSMITINENGTQDKVVVNGNGGDVDFRVEGDTDEYLLFTDASTDRVGIGTSTPAATFHVDGSVRFEDLTSGILKVDGDGDLSVDTNTYLTAHPSISAASSVNNSGRTYIQDITLDSNGHVTGITTATETVTDTNTQLTDAQVRSKISGTGLISYNSSTGVISTTANNYSLPAGSSSTRGGFKIGYTENGKNYPVEVSSEKMYVNVPWTDTNTTYSAFAGEEEGLVPNGSSNDSSYFLDADGGWTIPPDTNTTYSAGSGLDLSGTTFSIESDLRDGITKVGKDSSNYIAIDADNNNSIDFYISGTWVARLEADGDLHVKGDVIAASDIFNP